MEPMSKIIAVRSYCLALYYKDLYPSESDIPEHVLWPIPHAQVTPRDGSFAAIVEIEDDDKSRLAAQAEGIGAGDGDRDGVVGRRCVVPSAADYIPGSLGKFRSAGQVAVVVETAYGQTDFRRGALHDGRIAGGVANGGSIACDRNFTLIGDVVMFGDSHVHGAVGSGIDAENGVAVRVGIPPFVHLGTFPETDESVFHVIP